MKIHQDESQNVEYKESWNDKYLEWICGFANAQGGRIFIGVNDAHEVTELLWWSTSVGSTNQVLRDD